MIEYIAQEEPGGCLVACVAMVTGRSYATIRQLCASSYNNGIHEVIADDILGELGFAIVRKYKHIPRLKTDRLDWPLLPFAPAHICLVHATQGAHAVVMLHTGDVYDPWNASRQNLRHPDYTQIDHITGIFKV